MYIFSIYKYISCGFVCASLSQDFDPGYLLCLVYVSGFRLCLNSPIFFNLVTFLATSKTSRMSWQFYHCWSSGLFGDHCLHLIRHLIEGDLYVTRGISESLPENSRNWDRSRLYAPWIMKLMKKSGLKQTHKTEWFNGACSHHQCVVHIIDD